MTRRPWSRPWVFVVVAGHPGDVRRQDTKAADHLAGLAAVLNSGGRRTIFTMAKWWSIEVLHGEFSAFRWQERHDSALIEAALTNGAVDGSWHADRWGVVFEICFDNEERWETSRSLNRKPRRIWTSPAFRRCIRYAPGRQESRALFLCAADA